ncbi:hypothetical protein BDP55DRAFT_672121 [Colletotrichum godetiae]|uniref:Uncharacterized protein n=1 Tax=Colletotrichum godetiae TaxID=1209918 RepID=A0AAJ0ESS7_9PEZI|nr:uncharacterized protein BDP55DRAFT_672121 [Colletotrichum godetiae]KAK1672623.1 hypothetical protein BDP55DRAFT_672121 [Colletotrichum godetiae]
MARIGVSAFIIATFIRVNSICLGSRPLRWKVVCGGCLLPSRASIDRVIRLSQGVLYHHLLEVRRETMNTSNELPCLSSDDHLV